MRKQKFAEENQKLKILEENHAEGRNYASLRCVLGAFSVPKQEEIRFWVSEFRRL
jgi:hypothetical protein